MLQEQQDLATGVYKVKDLELQFQRRTNILRQALEEDDASHAKTVENETVGYIVISLSVDGNLMLIKFGFTDVCC